MNFTDDQLWIEQQIMRGVLAPGARDLAAAEAAQQHNESHAVSTTDPAYLVPPTVIVDRVVCTEPQVWVGCLECYNGGDLVGDWFKAAEAATVTTSALHGRPIAPETHEELWVMDTEGIPVRYEMSPATATVWAEVLELVPEHAREPFDAWLLDRDWRTDPDTALVAEFEEKYAGRWDSFEDFASEWVANSGVLDGVPEEVVRYFDHWAYARDLEHGYDVIRCPGGVYVFNES